MRAGRGVVFEISRVTKPSHSGSNGVTLTMMAHRAYVLLPTEILNTGRGALKYSTERARANELGGTMQMSVCTVTNERSSKCLGSTMDEFTLVKILNSSATRRS